MKRLLSVLLVSGIATAAVSAAPPKTPRPRVERATPAITCGDPLAVQVRLDREGFSPGEIDRVLGAKSTQALAAFQQAHGLPITGKPDCRTWKALGGDTPGPAVVSYTITDEDVRGPFSQVATHDPAKAADVLDRGYTSVIEALSERFHVSPTWLRTANARVRFSAGATITVPAVTPFDATAKPARDPAAADISLHVSRRDSTLRATRADGTLMFFAPVSSGSVHDPLPPGHWKVTGVSWHPVFSYNPDLFWDAKPKDEEATMKAGPNNPVGVVWIDLDLEHYGIHGTPEPGQIGRAESHGCVRLTNWDAARLATLVRPGTSVLFE